MAGDNTEKPAEQGNDARVEGERIEHGASGPDRVERLDELRQAAAAAHLRARIAAAPPKPRPASPAKDRRNQGTVIALVAVAVVVVLVVVGFGLLMWRLHKSDKRIGALEVEVLG